MNCTHEVCHSRGVTLVSLVCESRGVLDPADLREIDRLLLEYLSEGRVTPVYCRQRILADGHREDITRGYLHQRLVRLVEHGHVRNLLDTGLYELTDDPRSADSRS